MKKMSIVFIIVGLVLVLLFSFVFYYGGFNKISFKIEKQGGEVLVYKTMKGDYSKSGKPMDEIYHFLVNNYNIKTYKGFGIYYDDPQKVAKKDLRSDIGCIVEGYDSSEIKLPNGEIKMMKYPEKKYIVSEFPYNGSISVIFGVLKVYPALRTYLKENNYAEEGAVMEIYDVPNKTITYRKEIIE